MENNFDVQLNYDDGGGDVKFSVIPNFRVDLTSPPMKCSLALLDLLSRQHILLLYFWGKKRRKITFYEYKELYSDINRFYTIL